MTKNGRQVFQIQTQGVSGNKVMNIPRTRRHVCKYKRVTDQQLKCNECNESIITR